MRIDMRLRQIVKVKRRMMYQHGSDAYHRIHSTRAAGSNAMIEDGGEHGKRRLFSAQEECVANISIVEDRNQCTLVLEGELIAPSIVEFRNACKRAKADPKHRELVVQIRNLTTISQEGENLLLDLMKEGVRFQCSGGFTRQVIRQLFRRVPGDSGGIKRCQPYNRMF
jgi:hypothetical protein